MTTISMPRAAACLLVASAAIGVAATSASGQGFGLRSGAHVNPDQFSVGGQYELGTSLERVWLQPSTDLGFGNDAFLTALNFDLMYRRPLARGTTWTAFAGGGPALNFYRLPGYSVTEAGANLAGGLMHRSGWFSELRAGFFESPQLGFGAGYRFQPGRQGSRPAATPPTRRPPPRATRR